MPCGFQNCSARLDSRFCDPAVCPPQFHRSVVKRPGPPQTATSTCWPGNWVAIRRVGRRALASEGHRHLTERPACRFLWPTTPRQRSSASQFEVPCPDPPANTKCRACRGTDRSNRRGHRSLRASRIRIGSDSRCTSRDRRRTPADERPFPDVRSSGTCPEPASALRRQPSTAVSMVLVSLTEGTFYVRGVPEKGLASRTSDPLSSVPQVAQATAAAGNRSLPSAVRGGGRRGLANPLRPRRAGPSGPRTEGPCGSLVGPPHPFLRDLNGSVGTDPNRKRTGTQE